MNYDDPELVLADLEERMDKAVSVCAEHLGKIRTGRASTGMLESVRVDYYGSMTPLIQLAQMTVPDARTILITPFDPSTLPLIEKAIMQADLGLTPNSGGDAKSRYIRINVPDLNEERRKELIRVARKEAEDGRVAVRNIRREANDALKKLEKDGAVSSDEAHRFLDEVQRSTDRHTARIDQLLAQKEQDLTKI